MWSRFLLFAAVQCSQHHLFKRLPLFQSIVFCNLSRISWPQSCVSIYGFFFYSIDDVRVLLSLLYCLHNHNFEIPNCDIFFFGFFQHSFAESESFIFIYKFQDCFFHFLEKCWWCFHRVCTECIDCCWQHRYCINIYSPNP